MSDSAPTPPPPPPPGQPSRTQQPSSGIAVTALVCGLVGLVIALIPILGIFGIALGLVAVVLGLIGRSKAKKGEAAGKGMALAGAITGTLAVILGIIGLVIVGNAFNDLENAFDEAPPTFQPEATVTPTTAETTTSDEPAPNPTEAVAGTRDNPVPLGTVASFEDWDVSVDDVTLDATDEVVAANDFNSEPENGQYVLVTLTFTYTGQGEGNSMFAFNPVLVGSDARQYETHECMAVTPNPMSDAPTLENGGTFTGSDCFDIPPEALDGARLFLEPTMSFDDEARAYYQLPQ